MGHLIPRVLVIGLGAAVSPVAIMILLAVMVKKDAKRNSLLFIAGYTLVLVVVGLAAMFLFGAVTHKPGTSDAVIDIVLGALCLAFIPLSLKRKPKPQKEDGGMNPLGAVALGAGAMLVNTSTWVFYLGGVHAITQAKNIGTADTAIAFIILIFMTLLTLTIPVGILLVFPVKSQKFLDALGEWLARHRKTITVALLLIFAVYLIWKGIGILV